MKWRSCNPHWKQRPLKWTQSRPTPLDCIDQESIKKSETDSKFEQRPTLIVCLHSNSYLSRRQKAIYHIQEDYINELKVFQNEERLVPLNRRRLYNLKL
jgi:hypothetical protein